MQSMHTIEPPLLTAQQVQRMLGVDRSTVYRMAEDGRLPALKIGRQWRFPSHEIERLLVVDHQGVTRPGAAADPTGGAASSVISVAADLLGVMMVVTDMHGRPLTAVANPCTWFAARAEDQESIAACVAEWQLMADDLDFEPRFRTGLLGFECARAYIRSGSSLVGMVLAGGVAPAGTENAELHRLDDEQRRRVLTALPKISSALSRTIAPPESSTPRPTSATTRRTS